jgi:hypothetical protein
MSVVDPEKRKIRDEEEQDVNNIDSVVETAAASDEIDAGYAPPEVEGAEAATGVGASNPNAHIRDGRDTRFLVTWDGSDDPANPQVSKVVITRNTPHNSSRIMVH